MRAIYLQQRVLSLSELVAAIKFVDFVVVDLFPTTGQID